MKRTGLASAAQPLLESARLSLSIAAAPLAILVAQSRTIQENQSETFRVFISISLVCFIISTLIGIISLYRARMLKAKLDFDLHKSEGERSVIIERMEKPFGLANTLSDESFARTARWFVAPFVFFVAVGYTTGLLALLSVIWGEAPAK